MLLGRGSFRREADICMSSLIRSLMTFLDGSQRFLHLAPRLPTITIQDEV